MFFDSKLIKSTGLLLLTISLTSSIASKSLFDSVKKILDLLPENINEARKELKNIVGRDVKNLDQEEILRATAETASENSVDGIFAPIFWMIIGTIIWNYSTELPGPLALSWGFKASSTIDSMIGYKKEDLRWLGTAGAKIDDLLTWMPCRLVLFTLPLISKPLNLLPNLVKSSIKEGSLDDSPNSGISEAIFANCLEIQMGGENIYNGIKRIKPILGGKHSKATKESIRKLISYIIRLEILWIIMVWIIIYFIVLF